jgi:peptidoglycan DL-endopeptidase CwlO
VQSARTRLRALTVAALAVAITGSAATAAHAAPSTGDINKRIATAQNQLEDVVESYNKMTISLKKTVSDQRKLAASLGPAKEALDAASSQVSTIAASEYRTGKIGTMNILLEGPNDLIERMSIIDAMSRSRTRDIATYTATTQDYSERQATLKATEEKQSAEVRELGARKKKIESDIKKLRAMKIAATGSATDRNSGPYSGPVPSVSGSAGAAVRFAYGVIGRPYGYAKDGPGAYDCSGLTLAAWRAAGRSLPHNAAEQYSATARISRSELRPGDLVFYRGNGHVALYVGGNQIIDAPHEGAYVGKRTIDIMTPNGYGRVG